MPLALLASPIFLAALNFLLSGGLDIARREFDPNAIKPTPGEVLPVVGATAAGAVAGPVGGAVAGATSPFLGSLAQLGLTTAAPLFARDLSAQANPNTTRPQSISQAAGPTPAQLAVQRQQALATQQQGQFGFTPQQVQQPQSPTSFGSFPSPQQSQPPSFPPSPYAPAAPTVFTGQPQYGDLTSSAQIRSLLFAGR